MACIGVAFYTKPHCMQNFISGTNYSNLKILGIFVGSNFYAKIIATNSLALEIFTVGVSLKLFYVRVFLYIVMYVGVNFYIGISTYVGVSDLSQEVSYPYVSVFLSEVVFISLRVCWICILLKTTCNTSM